MFGMSSLSHSVSEYVRLDIPISAQLFVVEQSLEATPFQRNTAVSGSHTLAIHQYVAQAEEVHRFQVFVALPLEKRFRILLLDWDLMPRNRAIMGYLMFERMPGVIKVSDYRMSLAEGEIPDILKADTVYMLGIRFEGMRCPVKIVSTMTDSSGILYRDVIITQRIGIFETLVASDRAIVMRPGIHRDRVINNPTRVICPARNEPNVSNFSTRETATIEEVTTTSNEVVPMVSVASVAQSTDVGTSSTIPTLSIARMIRPFADLSLLPVARVTPFLPNVDPSLYRHYPNVPGPSTSMGVVRLNPPPPEETEWDSDNQWDTRDYR